MELVFLPDLLLVQLHQPNPQPVAGLLALVAFKVGDGADARLYLLGDIPLGQTSGA